MTRRPPNRWRGAVILAVATLVLLVGASPVAAAVHSPTGNRIGLFVADGTTYPSATAFYVQSGFFFDPGDPAAGVYQFNLDLDGTPVRSTYVTTTSYPDGSLSIRLWTFNFPAGLSGVHTLTGHYLVPCGSNPFFPCGSLRRNTLIEWLTPRATVTFAP